MKIRPLLAHSCLLWAMLMFATQPVPAQDFTLAQPREGESFLPGDAIPLRAEATDGAAYLWRVAFLDGNRVIAEAKVNMTIRWQNAGGGSHVITARATIPDGTTLTSAPVTIQVGPGPALPVVRIVATHPIAEEDSLPFDRFPFIGMFTVSRTGPTNTALPVFVQYTGTAIPETDYPPLPWLVTIPAGATSSVLRVEAILDGVTEGLETLVARISNCPPPTDPPMGMPCYAFDIDPAHASATVFLRDDGVTVASLAIDHPRDGDQFAPGAPIFILAIATDLEGHISRVEFWDGDQRIGVSEITFVRVPDPGTPIHHPFAWPGASNGVHVLTARAVSSAGTAVQSTPVRVTVGSIANQPPSVAIVRPAAGEEFPPMTAIEMVAEARDADGSVRQVEFLADGRKLGEAGWEFIQARALGETQTFTFVWRSPSPGRHVLTARAIDNDGSGIRSAPVEIRVTEPAPVPLVAVMATDPFAMEPGTNATLNTATFRIRRFGPTNAALVIGYSLRGTAQNGVDFDLLPGLITLPAGQRTIEITVRPLNDELVERLETVVLQLGESPVMGPMPQYRIGIPAKAVAVISDSPWLRPPVMGRCLPADDGVFHVCFDAESGYPFRVEASRDMRNWETICDAVAADGAVHVVDEDTASGPQRFYRIAPEPLGVPEP